MAEVMKKATRDSYGEALVELGQENPNIVVFDADLAGATKTGVFKKAFPDRFFDCGIAEGNMMVAAAGVSTCGYIPFSTGGFTDCMLQNGAVKVFAVDVGHGQLAWSLRNDPRVICMEKTNIRYVVPEDIGCAVDFVSIDVSFISLTKVLVPVKELMAERGQIVCLIKPQFEAGREKVGKKGVVREKETHMEVVRMVMDFALSIGFGVLGLAFSPIKGPEGNIEYLLYLQKTPTEEELNRPLPDVKALVEQSHELL